MDPRSEHYDAVVIGSGFGGVSTAALLARAGLSVLLCERADALGGYGHTLDMGAYRFDPAVHFTGQGGPAGLFTAVLKHLGTNDQVEMIEVDRFYNVVLPDGRTVRSEAGFDGIVEGHARVFPDSAADLETFFRMCMTMHNQLHAMPMTLGLHNLDEVATAFPEYFSHRPRTLDDVAREYIADAQARSSVCALWPYQGTVPSRLGFVTLGQLIANAVEGVWYPLGGFSSLIDAVAAGLEAHGGEVVTGNGATRIVVEDGKAAGVVLGSGHEVRAPFVISNADARHTFLELVGADALPANFLRRMARLTLCHSAFVAFVGTDMDLSGLDLAHEIFVPTSWDHEDETAAIAEGRPAGEWIGAPSLVDRSLAPPGEQALVITSLAAYDIGRPWDEHRDAFCDALLERAERAIPGLRDNVTFLQTATPEAFVRFTGNDRGSVYGWEHTPNQAGTQRLAHHTPIKGLLLSGHWTLPGSGSLRSFASGVHTAGMVLRELGAGPPIPADMAQAANLPSLD